MITHVRIDERLAHGQVCVRWVTKTKVSTLIVLDDATAGDSFLKKVVISVAPRGINIEVCSREDIMDIVERFNNNPLNSAMIVTKVPEYVLQLVESGATDITSLTVGNMGAGLGRTKVTTYTWISEKEKQEFLNLHEKGVKLETRQLPDDKAIDFAGLLLKRK